MTRLFEKEEPFNLFRWIKYRYWAWLPYDWRPGQILYRLKCFIFKRYTTTKPRTLKYHTWCDRRILMPHTMFEILSRFLEEECCPGHVEWYGENGHKIKVCGKEVYVRDEMEALYNWWHKIYNKWYPDECDRLYKEIEKHRPIYMFNKNNEYKPKFETQKDDLLDELGLLNINALERKMDNELQDRLHRLVNCIPFMWT